MPGRVVAGRPAACQTTGVDCSGAAWLTKRYEPEPQVLLSLRPPHATTLSQTKHPRLTKLDQVQTAVTSTGASPKPVGGLLPPALEPCPR